MFLKKRKFFDSPDWSGILRFFAQIEQKAGLKQWKCKFCAPDNSSDYKSLITNSLRRFNSCCSSVHDESGLHFTIGTDSPYPLAEILF